MAIRGRRANKPEEEPQVVQEYATPIGVAEEAVDTVVWDDGYLNFKALIFQQGCQVNFYGWYRISGAGLHAKAIYSIDLYARHGNREISLKSIPFPEDPRLNIAAVNEKIMAHCNEFFAQCIVPHALSWAEFEKLMTAPSGKINRAETIDRLLIEARATRDTAFSAAGTRFIKITPDEGQPYTIELDLTRQARALDGKVPSLEYGTIADIALRDGKGQAGKRLKVEGSKENIESLAARLAKATDAGEQRRIRALMRQMGHKGGVRALKAKPAT